MSSLSAGFPKSDVATALRAGRPDVVILVEPPKTGADAIARDLGFERTAVARNADQAGTEILSRFPIAENLGRGARIVPCGGLELTVFSQHFEPYPYGPYDVRDKPSLTADSLVKTAEATHGGAVSGALAAMKPWLDDKFPLFVGGDFNEPSYLDWTSETAAQGLHFGRVVAWPSTKAFAAAGLVDSFRAVHTDPVKVPGETWTPYPDPNEVHDRIDYLLHAGRGVSVRSAEVVGETMAKANIVLDGPFPSDHRFVVVEYVIRGKACP